MTCRMRPIGWPFLTGSIVTVTSSPALNDVRDHPRGVIDVGLCVSTAQFRTVPVSSFVSNFRKQCGLLQIHSVTEWIWSNPHCFLKFDTNDDTGTVRNWAVETQSPTSMTPRGWSRTSFKAGDEVTVTIEPVKNGQPIGRILHVILPNGQKLIAANPTTPESRPVAPVPVQ